MKKRIKMIVVLVLVLGMVFVSSESYLAYAVNWQIVKTPGFTGVETEVHMPYWERDWTYELYSLTGTCTYVVAKCVTDPDDSLYYSIDNTISGFMHTKPDRVTFRLAYTWWGQINTVDSTFKISIEHNSNNLVSENLTATGAISN